MNDFETQVGRALARRLDTDIGFASVHPQDGEPADLYPEEEARIANAVERRRKEMAAGRQAARLALRRLDGSVFREGPSIPPGPGGAPRFPDQTLGSIAHCEDLCVAIAASTRGHRSIGVDIEALHPLEQDLVSTLATPAEQPVDGLDLLRVFTAKEAFYKAQSPLTGLFLDFLDVAVERDEGDAMAFRIRLLNPEKKEAGKIAASAYGYWLEPPSDSVPGYLIATCAVVAR